MKVNQAKFTYFLNTPIINDKEDDEDAVNFIYYQSPSFYIYNDTISIEKTLFLQCKSQNTGGGIHYVNKDGLFSATNTYFHNCVSYMQGGGAYCKCSEIQLNSIIFTLCNGVNSQAGYFETSVYSDINYILIYNCFISGEVTYMGPVLDINNNYVDSYFSPMASDINASYNTIRTDTQGGLISIKCVGFDIFSSYYMYYFTIFENTCPSEIECHGTDYITIYANFFNMVQNHISKSAFIISGDNYLFATECFIGHDYNVFYFPKQTPYPTESPMPTIIPPTAPNFTLNNWNVRRHKEENQAEHYEYVYDRAKKKFEKVFYVPDEEVEKFLNQVNSKKNENDHDLNYESSKKLYHSKNKIRSENSKNYKKNNVLNRYAYYKENKNDHYINDKTNKFVNPNNKIIINESPEIVLALFPDNSGSILFVDSKIDYPEMDRVECEDQCYMSDFETLPIEEHTLLNYEIIIEEETTTNQNSIIFKFPTNKMNIILISIIIVATLILYAMTMTIACARLRIRNEDNINEDNNNNNVV